MLGKGYGGLEAETQSEMSSTLSNKDRDLKVNEPLASISITEATEILV